MIKQHLPVMPTLIMMAALLGALPAFARQAMGQSAPAQNRSAPPVTGAHLLR